MLSIVGHASFAQAVFESNGSGGGRFEDGSSWQLISGSDADGVPDSDDDVTILLRRY